LKTSRTGRLGGKRACLCKDGTYSTKCCDGSIWAQGIGNISAEVPNGSYKYLVEHCSNGKRHHAHIEDTELTIGAVYYLRFLNSHHDGCHTIISDTSGGGLLIKNATLYTDCSDCQTQNP
jgi:hypothetical protein